MAILYKKIKSANIDFSSQISEANIKGQFINDVITGGEGWGISQKMTNDDRMTAHFWTWSVVWPLCKHSQTKIIDINSISWETTSQWNQLCRENKLAMRGEGSQKWQNMTREGRAWCPPKLMTSWYEQPLMRLQLKTKLTCINLSSSFPLIQWNISKLGSWTSRIIYFAKIHIASV